MPDKSEFIPDVKPVNLGGTVIDPFTVEHGRVPLVADGAGGAYRTPSLDDEFLAGAAKAKGVAAIPTSSFYHGERYTASKPNTDTEEMAAQQQGFGQKLENGLLKMAGTAGTTFLSGTVGLLDGIGEWLSTGKFASLYNNDFNKWMDSLNKQMEDAAPNYYTHTEQDADWYSPSNILTGNFLSDKIIKNIGFSIGAIGGGAVWTQAFKAIGLVNALMQAGKGLETAEALETAITNAPKAERFGAVNESLNSLAQKYVKQPIATALRDPSRILTSVMGTAGESSMEALNNSNEFRDKMIKDYVDKNGVRPTGTALDEINQYADKVGNYSWGMNVALLSATNYIQLPKILGSSKAVEKAAINGIEMAGDGTWKTTFEGLSKTQRRLSRVWNVAKLTFAPAEAFEEGAQYVIQEGTQDFFKGAYTKNVDDKKDFWEALGGAMKKAITTKEGMENILIGGLAGGLQTSFSPIGANTVKERGFTGQGGERARETQKALELLNGTKGDKALQDSVAFINMGIDAQKKRQEAIRNNDTYTEKNAETDFLLSYIMPRAKYGKIESVKQELDLYRKQATDDIGFQQLVDKGYAHPDESKVDFVKRLDQIEATALEVNRTYDMLHNKYGNNPAYTDHLVDKMVYSSAKILDLEKRIQSLDGKLAEKGVDPSSTKDALVKSMAWQDGKIDDAAKTKEVTEAVVNVVKDIDSREITDDKKEELKQNFSDYLDMVLSRKTYLNEYNEFKNNPSKYGEAPKPIEIKTEEEQPTGEEKKTVTIKTKDGTEEIAIGEEYFLGRVVEESKEGKEFHRFPRLTILGENEDGTIKIKDSGGNIKDVSKAELEDYHLGKVSDTLKNKKAKFFLENVNTIFQLKRKNSKKPLTGRLEYNSKKDTLTFVYKNDWGKTSRMEVTNTQFVPKKGYKEALITAIGKLTREQEQSIKDYAESTDSRALEVNKERISILENLFSEVSSRHEIVDKLLKQKKEEFDKLTSEIKELEGKIKEGGLTKRNNFKATTSRAIKAANKLSRLQEQLRLQIDSLQTEKDELESKEEYISNLIDDVDSLPYDNSELLADLKNEKKVLEDLVLKNGTEINKISSLIDSVEQAIDKAVDFVRNLISTFEKKYPNVPTTLGQDWVTFLQANPNFLKLRPQFKEDLALLQETVAEMEDYYIAPNEEKIKALREVLTDVQKNLEESHKAVIAKMDVLNRFEDLIKDFEEKKIEEEKLKNNEKVKKQLLSSMGGTTENPPNNENYEPSSKKSDEQIPTSTIVPSVEFSKNPLKPHHVRANTFGVNMPNMSNKDSLRGIFVTAKNQDEVGLPGLIEHLKGEEDVNPDGIVAFVVVQIDEKGKRTFVGEDGKPLTTPTKDNTIYQVFPESKLEWSNGESMFRKGTNPAVAKAYKEEYAKWRQEIIDNPNQVPQTFDSSFGNVVFDRDAEGKRTYKSSTVEEAGLVVSNDTRDDYNEKRLINVPTTGDTFTRGSVSFANPLGRAFLLLPNGAVKLNSNKLTEQQANTTFGVIKQLAKYALEDKLREPEAQQLFAWIKSIVHWGIPSDKKTSNSTWFESTADGLVLHIKGEDTSFEFTPLSLEANKGQITALLKDTYHNVNSTLTSDNNYNSKYTEITGIKEDGTIITKVWDNYQTYLLSGKDREAPLNTQLKAIDTSKPEDTNRVGVYFTLTDMQERFKKSVPKAAPVGNPVKPGAPVVKEEIKEGKKEEKPSTKYTYDGVTKNQVKLGGGEVIDFVANSATDFAISIPEDKDTPYWQAMDRLSKDNPDETLNSKRIAKAVLNAIEADLATVSIPEVKPTTTVEEAPKVEQAASQALKDAIKRKKSDAGSEYRMKVRNQIKRFQSENWDKVSEWLSKNLPNFPVYRVKNIINNLNGTQALGMFKNAALYIYDKAESGTAYHEAFEGVWKTFTSPEERTKIVDEFRNRKGSFIERETGKEIPYNSPDLTVQQVKEQLAEEFIDYVQDKKLPPRASKARSVIERIFSELVAIIKGWFKYPNSKTEELFSKINSGYYKNFIPSSYEMSFANKGIMDINTASGDDNTEYRSKIQGFTEAQVHEVIQQMTYDTITTLFESSESLFNVQKRDKEELYNTLKNKLIDTVSYDTIVAMEELEAGNVTQAEVDPYIAKTEDLLGKIESNWDTLVERHAEYLRSFNIEFDENDRVILNSEDNSGREDYIEANKIDHFKKANGAVKILLASLPKTDASGNIVESSIGGVSLVPLSNSYMALLNKLNTSRSFEEMMDRLRKMAEQNSTYRKLFKRLTKTSYNSNSDILADIKDKHDLQLLSAFYNTFNKQNPDVKNVFIFDNGSDVEIGDSNFSDAARQERDKMSNSVIAAIKQNKTQFKYVDKQRAYIPNADYFRKKDLSTDERKIAFLKEFGISFNEKDIAKLKVNQQAAFRRAVDGMKKSFVDAQRAVSLSDKVLDIKGPLLTLGSIKATINNPEFDSTFFNVNGERVQTFMNTNTANELFKALSQVKNIRELEGGPYSYLLTDEWAANSSLLNRMFNPKTGNKVEGAEDLMKTSYADGTVDQSTGKNKQSSKQTYLERLTQEINMNMAGYQYALVPGDAGMEWMIYMGNPVSESDFLGDYAEINNIFKGFFISEVNLSKEGRNILASKKRNKKDLRFFRPILGEELHSKIIKDKREAEKVYEAYEKEINSAVKAFIENRADKLYNQLRTYGVISFGEKEGLYKVSRLTFGNREEVSMATIINKLKAVEANYIINNIDLHKVLFSDPYQYEDELKRIKSFLSPRQAIIANSPDLNAAMDRIWNRGYGKDDIGRVNMMKDHFNTFTIADVLSTDGLPNYDEAYKETDGGGIITFQAYRNFRIRASNWNDDEERQYRYDIAYEKKIKGIALSEEESKLLEKGSPNIKSAYTTLKPIVSGNKLNEKGYNDIVLDKFALYPLSFRIMHEFNPSSNAIRLYNKMQKEKLDYGVFDSGRKVGAELDNKGHKIVNNLYKEDGSFNDAEYTGLVAVPNHIIGVQSEIPSKEDNLVTRGSQITKLATMDMMQGGIPIDTLPAGKTSPAEFAKAYEEWNGLDEKAKLAKSPLYREIRNNQDLLEKITDEGYKNLLDELGIREDGDKYVITDYSRTARAIRNQVLSMEVNNNISKALEGFENGDAVIEATPAYQQVRNILYSIVDKNILSKKISGGQKVQLPSSLLEDKRAAAVTVNGKPTYASDVLKFYTNEEGKRVCEIFVSRWFKSSMSDKELLKYLNTKEGQEILKGIGFRVPTQRQNSIDAFVIKGFLPQEFGDNVIIPSALVKKVGSDFDIDKLFMYLKNVEVDKTGTPYLIKQYNVNTKDKAQLKDFYEDILLPKYKRAEEREKKGNIENAAADLFSDLSGLDIDEVDFSNKVPTIEEFLYDYTGLSKEDFNRKLNNNRYRKALENEYIESLQNIISSEQNFANLVRPNSADQLKYLANEITKKLGYDEIDYSSTGNMLNRIFMSRLRQAFVRGKYAIGIAAVAQTNHSLNQRTLMYVDPKKLVNQSDYDQYWLGNGKVLLPHNKVKVDGEELATLSMIYNQDGDSISDIISQFIDGYVDISKGPWIMELGATPNVAGTFLFLAKIGVPIDTIAYFMNQPIVKEYLKELEVAGYTGNFSKQVFKDILDSANYRGNDKEIVMPSKNQLEKMVGKKELTDGEKAQQRLILGEFVKYAALSNQMLTLTQGSNFDTATFNDPYLVFKKLLQLGKARNGMISSVDNLLKESFIKNTADNLVKSRDAVAEILQSDKGNVRKVLQTVLAPFADMNDFDFVKMSRKAVNDLFDWAVQVDRKLNEQIFRILVQDDSTAMRVKDFVESVKKDANHPLYNNQLIDTLEWNISGKEYGADNVRIANKDNKVYDQNMIIAAFDELKTYLEGQNSTLYGDIMRLAVLQSGLNNSKISFTSLIPYDDFKSIYNKTLSTLNDMPNLNEFVSNDVFYRNNWNNNEIIPYVKARSIMTFRGPVYNPAREFLPAHVHKKRREGEIPELVSMSTKSLEGQSPFIVYSWEVGTPAEKAKMRKEGDFSYIRKGLFKKVMNGDEPLINNGSGGKTYYIYKMINAWGDSFRANEFYDTARPSAINNGFMQVRKGEGTLPNGIEVKYSDEVDDATIANVFFPNGQPETKDPFTC